ncbi:hypothetical protein F5Y09DRAFT_298597 [Xylaria sp. FL1042]|nr:hypothetical protein F5Y09DRAFT_298597 [Xylaria sp. FL1042]
MSEPDERRPCFDSRCSLCRFELVSGEKIAAVVDGGKVSRVFSFGPRKFWDDSLSITLVRCQGECLHYDGKAFPCHVECLRFAAHKPLTNMFHALAYAFEPVVAAETQRCRWIQLNFASKLSSVYRLPRELALMISQYCIREFAISAAWLPITAPNTYSVDLRSEVWARYVIIDGVQYFASLTNQHSADAQLILNIEKAASVDTIYIAEDHLGIQQIHFGNLTLVKPDKNAYKLWWRTISIRDIARLHVNTDGLKIRSFKSFAGDEISRLAENVAWHTPEHRPELIRFHSLNSTSPAQLRMTTILCNSPYTTAYSASWDWSILCLHAHNADKNLAFYDNVQTKNALWLYMPIDKGEYISQIWKRFRRLARELALLIITNKGRVMMLGPQPQPHWRRCNWTLLHQSKGTSSRMFFDVSPNGIHKLAFESLKPTSQDERPIIPTPLSLYPESTSLDDYFYTSAALENVIEFTPCERNVAGRLSIIGLLFRYSDGTQACIGQFRLDCAAIPLVVANSSRMWLSLDTEDGFPFVKSVGVSQPPRPMSQRCLYVSWVGRLEWWFSHKQCKLYYQSQASIATKA